MQWSSGRWEGDIVGGWLQNTVGLLWQVYGLVSIAGRVALKEIVRIYCKSEVS